MSKSTKREEVVKAALEEVRRRNGGRLTPRDVIAAAKNKKSPLHLEFIWSDAKAAALQREDRARELITRYLTVVVINKSYRITAPYYIRDPRLPKNVAGYVALTSSELNRNDARDVVLSELDRCRSAIERARAIAGVLNTKHVGLSDQLEGLLSDVVSMRSAIVAAE